MTTPAQTVDDGAGWLLAVIVRNTSGGSGTMIMKSEAKTIADEFDRMRERIAALEAERDEFLRKYDIAIKAAGIRAEMATAALERAGDAFEMLAGSEALTAPFSMGKELRVRMDLAARARIAIRAFLKEN